MSKHCACGDMFDVAIKVLYEIRLLEKRLSAIESEIRTLVDYTRRCGAHKKEINKQSCALHEAK